MDHRRWKTEPLRSWGKCKELRLNHYREVSQAREEGKLLVTGGLSEIIILPAGLGDFVFFSGEPYGASLSTDAEFCQACTEAVESLGYARDICSYFRNYLGSMHLDRYFFGGPFPKAEFCLSLHNCDSHAKWYQTVSDHFGIPFFGIDLLNHAPGRHLEERGEYLAGQLYDAIEWMERVSGRQYDDEKLIEAIHIESEIGSLWAQTCILNQAIPAPLDQKSMWSLYLPAGMLKWQREALEFHRMLQDEVQDRVNRGIGSLATERCRLIHDGMPPWFFLRIFRLMEQYGAVCIGSQYCFGLTGFFSMGPDGSWQAAKTPRELGIPLRNRDDAVRYFAQKILSRVVGDGCYWAPAKNDQNLSLVRQWQAQGMVIHLNRGCEGMAQHQLEMRLGLLEAGIPVMTYEGNMADKREFDEAQVLDRLESFMESLELQKLPAEE
ncbi:MAG: 2-hydroxyacyl-CoA dehydratase [Dehalococcoidia bacterium]